MEHNSPFIMSFKSRIRRICIKTNKYKVEISIILCLTIVCVHYYNRIKYFDELTHFSRLVNISIQSSDNLTYENLIKHNLANKIVLSGRTGGGYGNKLYGFLSSLVIAILTNSKLYSIWPNIDQFIEVPFLKTTFTEFESFSSSILVENLIYDRINVPQMESPWVMERDMDKIVNKKLSSNHSIYYYDKYDFLLMEICTNPIYYDKLQLNNLVRHVNTLFCGYRG